MYMLLSGVPPFDGVDDDEIMKNSVKGEYEFAPEENWKSVSRQAKDLISKMLVKNPEKRISASEILDHEWFAMLKEGTISRK